MTSSEVSSVFPPQLYRRSEDTLEAIRSVMNLPDTKSKSSAGSPYDVEEDTQTEPSYEKIFEGSHEAGQSS